MFKAAIITASDKGAQGLREDLSGPCIKKILEEANYEVVSIDILPDDRNLIADKLIELSDRKIPLILTTGGTGFAPRDNTPEATRDVIEKETPGISEAIRAESLKITPRAMLSRAVSGIRKQSLIINLPGSPKAVRECLDFILPTLEHGLNIMLSLDSECARK
ncbi:MogA/MoaB family molybdenum cofactor biosynthesis protein [Megamonas sp.]